MRAVTCLLLAADALLLAAWAPLAFGIFMGLASPGAEDLSLPVKAAFYLLLTFPLPAVPAVIALLVLLAKDRPRAALAAAVTPPVLLLIPALLFLLDYVAGV